MNEFKPGDAVSIKEFSRIKLVLSHCVDKIAICLTDDGEAGLRNVEVNSSLLIPYEESSWTMA